MYSSLLRKINIRRQEAGLTVYLFLTSVFLGIFLCTFDIAAHSIFFKHWEQKDLALAFIFSGILGIIVFHIYSLAYKRISVKLFNLINLIIILLATLSYLAYYIQYLSLKIAFFSIVIMFPVNLLALLNYWRYQRKILHPHQVRRISPVLEIGFMAGMIIGGSLIVFNLYFLDLNYLIIPLISIVAAAAMFILQFPTNLTHRLKKFYNHKRDKYIPVSSSFLLLSTRYTRQLFFFALLSAIMGFNLHFGFISLIQIRFMDIEKLSMVYATFIAFMFFLILLLDRFLIRKILYSYDSPYSLVLIPVGLGLFIIGTILLNFILRKLITGNEIITLFIILLGANKALYETSKFLIQSPSFKALYKTLDIRFLQVVIPRIEGTVVMLGMLIAGLIIYALSGLKLFIVYSIFLVTLLIAVVWTFYAIKLIKSYKNALQETYRKLRIRHAEDHKKESYTEKIRKILVGEDPLKVINAMKLSARIEPLAYEKSLQRMLANPQPIIQNYVLKCIEEESLLQFLPDLKNTKPSSPESEEQLKSIIEKFEERTRVFSSGINLEKLVNSREVEKRVLAAEIIGARKDITYTSSLVNLTREFEPDVKIAAVKAMARMCSPDHSYILIEFLSSPRYHAYAFEALIEIGNPALEYLERLFLDPNTDDNLLSRVIKIYGKIGTDKAIELLLNKLENQSKTVTDATIAALHESNFQASSLNLHKILNIIVRTIHVLGWNYLIFTSMSNEEKFAGLKNAFSEEINLNYDLLFDLLSLAYNAKTIREIKELINMGSRADISHAIEMMDHFVYEDIKPVLFPVLENISAREKVKRLQYYFPIETMTEEEMISQILTRNYNQMSVYPRICAMELALEKDNFKVTDELIANMFHPNKMLREVAALIVSKKDNVLFRNVFDRLDPELQTELKGTFAEIEEGNKLLLVEIYNILKNMGKFTDLGEGTLMQLAQAFQEVRMDSGSTLDLNDASGSCALFIVLSGEIRFENGHEEIYTEDEPELMYSNILVSSGISKIEFLNDGRILSIDHDSIETLLFDHAEMANCVLNCVEQFKLAG
ncbi:MAG: hypothetical protein PVF73_12735 [Bacteroidales bacterium]|jgi:hypothetical protein